MRCCACKQALTGHAVEQVYHLIVCLACYLPRTLRASLSWELASSPVSVQAVAKAAVAGATDPSVPSGIMDVWALKKYESIT